MIRLNPSLLEPILKGDIATSRVPQYIKIQFYSNISFYKQIAWIMASVAMTYYFKDLAEGKSLKMLLDTFVSQKLKSTKVYSFLFCIHFMAFNCFSG